MMAKLREYMRNAAYWIESFAQHPRKAVAHTICLNGKSLNEGLINNEIKRLTSAGLLDEAIRKALIV